LILAIWFKTRAFDDDNNKNKKIGSKRIFFVTGTNLPDYYKFHGAFCT